MSKKGDCSELRELLEALNNKELHRKCVQYGLNVPVVDSTREVIIRKLLKTMIGSPKSTKKQYPTTSEGRKTVQGNLPVSSDEEVQQERKPTRAKSRTRSPKGRNITSNIANHRSHSIGHPPNITGATAKVMATTTKQRSAQRTDVNANIEHGRILSMPVEANIKNDRGDYNIEVRHSDSGTILNKDRNFNHGCNNEEGYQKEIPSFSADSAYPSTSSNLGLSQTRTLNTSYQQDVHTKPRHNFVVSPHESVFSRPLGFYTADSSSNSFNNENMASHSSTMGHLGSVSSTQEPVFKRPTVLSKGNTGTTSYNQADAQRLYPRLPSEVPSVKLDPLQQKPSERINSLSKSGVVTTSYYQEIGPVKELHHFEVENGAEPAEAGGGDYDRGIATTGPSDSYERSNYPGSMQRSTNVSPRYDNIPLLRDTYATTTAIPKSPYSKQYNSPMRTNTSYTCNVDELDSLTEGEELSRNEANAHGGMYLAGNKKMYSSYGSNKIQERVPYRRSNSSRLSATPGKRYSQSPAGRRPFIVDNEEDDLNTSLRNFITTLDRKYHIKQMLCMFAVFAAAVFVYVMFVEHNMSMDKGGDVAHATKM